LGAAEAEGRMGSVIEILALRALALQAHHESSEALATMERSLTLAEPEGYVRVFVDEGAPMKALLSKFLRTRRKEYRDSRRHALIGYVQRLLAVLEAPRASTEPWAAVGYVSGQGQLLLDPLTTREMQVLALVTEGLSNREIATRLFIEVGTVKGHVHSILRKLEVDSRTKAGARARELGLISE
jgi:LuxR family maltose regulon positive regulatory protein